jgi:hypothetical protein
MRLLMRNLLAHLSLALLAACAGVRASGGGPIASASGGPKPEDQEKEMKEKGVMPEDPEARVVQEAFGREARVLGQRSGDLETVEVVADPENPRTKMGLAEMITSSEWILVHQEKREDGTALWRFIRPVKLRVETPTDGRPPRVGSK